MKSAAHQYEDKLLEFAYGELSSHEAEAVDAHVRGCTRCASMLVEIRAVRTTMAALPMEPTPDAGLESLLAYAEQAARRGGSSKVSPIWKRLLMPLASVMALVTVGVVAFRANQEFDTSPASVLADATLEERARGEEAKKEQAGPVGGAPREAPAPAVAATAPAADDLPAASELGRNEAKALSDSKLAAPQSSTRRAPSKKKNAPVMENDRDDYSNAAGRGALKKDVTNKPAPPTVQTPAQDKGGLYGLGSPSAAPQHQVAQEAHKKEEPAPVAAAPSPPPAPSPKSVKGGYGIKPQLGSSGSTSEPDSKSDEEALQQSDRLGADSDAHFAERKAAESRTRSLESARVASSRGDRLAETQLLAQVLQNGATGYERAEALKRLCDAYEALGEAQRADPFCDQLLQEFPTTAAARAVENRRKRMQRAAPASPPAQAPASSY